MAAALNRFISRSVDVCRPLFQSIKTSKRKFQWTEECEKALQHLKTYLTEPPLLETPRENEDLFIYLSVSPHAVSSVLVRAEGTEHRPVYYASKTLTGAETRYLPLEKVAFALVTASRKLLPYFQAHTIVVLTEYPLKALFRRADLSTRVSKWSCEMANFDIQYRPRTAIKAQVLADFIAELTPGEEKQKKEEPSPTLPEQPLEDPDAHVAIEDVTNATSDEESPKETETAELTPTPPSEGEPSPSADEDQATVPFSTWHMFHGNAWKLHVDGASNQRGAGAGVVLISPEGVIHENAISIEFPASNNEAEYEALIAGLRLAEAVDIKTLMVYSDSQLVVNQFNGDYDAKDERMAKYLSLAKSLTETFEEIEVHQVGREHNAHADALAGLASACKASEQRSVSFGTICSPSFDPPRTQMMNIELGPSWMDELVFYLRDDKLPED